jgi:hypothetical protein
VNTKKPANGDIATVKLATVEASLGLDDPDRPVAVPAGELDEWAWVIGRLASWLGQAGEASAADFAAYFHPGPARESTVWFLDQIAERIAALIDGRARP